MDPSERLAEIRRQVAIRREKYPNYPDTPEEQAEHLAFVIAMEPYQAEVIASMEEE